MKKGRPTISVATRQRHHMRAMQIVDRVCLAANSPDFTNDLQVNGSKLRSILRRRDNAALFNWLVDAFSHQGVSDALASGYMQRNGSLTWDDVTAGLSGATCPKLESFWRFEKCGYTKGSGLCTEPSYREACALPSAVLRNGRLNQLGYSLFLFTRDVAGGDLIGWIETRIQNELKQTDDFIAVGRLAIIEPMLGIYGVADKVLMMAFADLLMSAPVRYKNWFEVGSAMIAVDTLVHAFLARTGIIRLGRAHPYGPGCYQKNGCADVIRTLAHEINCQKFSPGFPSHFPRFVQFAIWHYCSQSGLDVCNGNRIDDIKRCANKACHVYKFCDRKTLK